MLVTEVVGHGALIRRMRMARQIGFHMGPTFRERSQPENPPCLHD